MIKDEIQKQEAGDDSTNLQAQSIILHQGISYSDAKEIALDVYKHNFLQLSQDAAQVAQKLAKELTDNFFDKLKIENEAAIASMNKPSMQAALYDAQKQYAKTGDKDLEGLLVDILVERALTPERNIRQIVLDESLTVAAKLIAEQMDALTINFIVSQSMDESLTSLPAMKKYLQTHIVPFISNLSKNESCYEHLEYAGCGSILEVNSLKKIEQLYQERYSVLFSKGISKEQLEKKIENHADYPDLFTSCLHDANLLQVDAVNVIALNGICEEQKIPDPIKQKATELFNSTLMSPLEVKHYLIRTTPGVEPLFDLWDDTQLSKLKLTPVGICIAQANLRKKQASS